MSKVFAVDRESSHPKGSSNSLASTSFKLTKDMESVAAKQPCSSLHRNLSGSHYLSKLGTKRLFGRQNSDSRACLRNGRFMDSGRHSTEGSLSQSGNGKQMMTISQIVESSRREDFAWSDVNGLSQNESMDADSLEEGMTLAFERIRVASHIVDSGHMYSDDYLQKCGICSRCVLHRSPWSFYGGSELPVVGVLVCGHVFHADCLEKSVSNMLKHDPPCPLCDRPETVVNKAFAFRGSMIPLKKRLAKTFHVRSSITSAKTPLVKQASIPSGHGKDKGVLLRSLSKIQFPLRLKSVKEAGTQSPGPAQILPDQT